MSDSDNNTDSGTVKRANVDFAASLSQARNSQKLALEDISEHLKIPVHTLEALEAGDIEALPAQAFTQGYIRSVARHLEIDEAPLLESYNSNFPDQNAERLKVRPSVAGEASSKSPLMLVVTAVLILAVVAAVIFGSVSYYQEKADVMETEREAVEVDDIGSSLDSPSVISSSADSSVSLGLKQQIESAGEPVAVNQSASLSEDDELMLTDEAGTTTSSSAEEVVESESEVVNQDVLRIYAEKGSWIEVRDANNERLLYNMVPLKGERTIIGQAPFSIIMGNARTTQIVVNNLEVDLSDYITSKNTATFSVSTQGQNIIFH